MISRARSVRLLFWERFSRVRDVRSFMFLTPASVNNPPHSSSDSSFLKSARKKNTANKVNLGKRAFFFNQFSDAI